MRSSGIPPSTRLRASGTAALGLSIAAILVITMVPTGRDVAHVVRLCLICGTGGFASLLLNVVLFVPLGAALRVRFGWLARALVAGFVLSLGIELTQLLIPGRFTTLADLVANTTGAGLGALFAVRPGAWLLPRAPTARALATGWTAAVVVGIVLTGALFAPSVPPGDMYAQWNPRLRALEQYEGPLIAAHVGDLPLTSGRIEREEDVRDLMRRGATIEVRFQAGPAPSALAPILRVVAGPYGAGLEAFQVGVDRDDLVIRPRYRADDYFFTRPDLRLRGELARVTPGDTVRAVVTEDPAGGHRVSARGRSPVLLGVTAARGWSLLRYFGEVPAWWLSATDLLWIAVLLFPLGWWAPSRAIFLLLGAAPLVALAAVPLWSALLVTPPAHYLAAGAGLAGGRMLRAVVRGVLPDESRHPSTSTTGRSGQRPITLSRP